MLQTYSELKEMLFLEIEEYIKETQSASIDTIDILSRKIEIIRDILETLKEYSITPENEKYFKKMIDSAKGIKKVKGITPLDLISRKIDVLRDQISFLRNFE